MTTHPLFAVEGVDAAGKATLVAELARRLSERAAHVAGSADVPTPTLCGGRAETFSFPAYDTPTGRLLRAHLRGEWAARATPCPRSDDLVETVEEDLLVRQALMTANRYEAQPAVLAALARGPVVLDRWWASSLAYGVAEGLDPAWVQRVSCALLRPTAWLLLDVDPAVARARRARAWDLNEADLQKLETARWAYRDLWARAGSRLGAAVGSRSPRTTTLGPSIADCGAMYTSSAWYVLDASKPARLVAAEAWPLVLRHVEEWEAGRRVDALDEAVTRRAAELVRTSGPSGAGRAASTARPDESLLWGVVHNAGLRRPVATSRWAAVQEAVGCGRAAAQALCARFGADPDERVGGTPTP